MTPILFFAGLMLTVSAPTPAVVPETPAPVCYRLQEEETAEPEKNGFEKFVAEYLSGDKVAMYLSWVAYIGTIIGLVANIKKLKQSNNLTLKNVSDDVKAVLEKTISEEVAKKFEEIIPNINAASEKTQEVLSIFAKILALSQENTSESRVAILNLIEQLGTVGKEVVEQAKTAIQESVELAEESKKQLDERLDEIIEEYDGTSI